MSRDEVPEEVEQLDLEDLNRMFSRIPEGPYSADARGEMWEVRAVDCDPTNSHHWPYRLCQSIAGQKAGCDPDVFGFIAGVINAWPTISVLLAARTPYTDQRAREAAEDERLAWFMKLMAACGQRGAECSDEGGEWVSVFCGDCEPTDTFNRASDLGLITVSHDSRYDTSHCLITKSGEAWVKALSADRQRDRDSKTGGA